MIRRALFLFAGPGLLALRPAIAAELATFATEQAAQRHCPADAVVWLNLPPGIYHFKGQRW